MTEKEEEEEAKDPVLEKFQDDFPLFVEAGFVAVKQLDEISASRLFHAAHLLQPDSPAPIIGMGYIALNKLEVKRATEIFQAVLEDEPDHDLAQAFLAICYLLKRDQRNEGEKMLGEIKGKTDDPTIVNLCDVSLEWSKKDLRGKQPPFFQQEK